jgi:DNA polymerase-1
MIITTEEELNQVLEILSTSEYIAFDFETNPSGAYPGVEYKEAALHHKMCEIEGLALRSETLEPIYIPFNDTNIPRLVLVERLRGLFSQDSLFIAHNIQFDAKIADYFFGVRPKHKFCTLVGYWYLDENAIKDAKTLGSELFDMKMIKFDEARKLSKEEFYEYAKRDAEVAYRLYFYLKDSLEEKHFDLASDIEMSFIDVLIDMTLHGTPCDLDYLKRGEDILTNKAIELEAKIYRELGEFNIGSPQQLCEKIFGIKIKRKKGEGVTLTKVDDYSPKKYAKPSIWNNIEDPSKRTPSTNEKALSRLDTPAANLIKEYRGIKKLLSTYAVGYQKYVVDGRIYPTFNNSGREAYQYGTVTGRLSSSAPNMQNIPHEPIYKDTTDSWWLREAIYAPEGYDLIIADEAQLEVRLLAHYSQDEKLIAAIKSGEDIHLATAKILFEKEDITPEERRTAKTQNFATAYGQGIQAMAEILFKDTSDESKEKAKQLRYRYYAKFKTLEAWVKFVGDRMASTKNKDHHVKTILGRKRRLFHGLPVIYSTDDEETVKHKRGQIARCKRQAVNSIIQGSASDVLKAAMVWIHRDFKEEGLDAHILLQIHDELVVECKHEQSEQAAAIMKKHMEHPFNDDLRVPLEVNPIICKKWSEGKN